MTEKIFAAAGPGRYGRMGNYLCCEALHVAGIHPQHRPADLSATQLRQLTGS
jgi:formamidopyrimidine-DNA glycosylase